MLSFYPYYGGFYAYEEYVIIENIDLCPSISDRANIVRAQSCEIMDLYTAERDRMENKKVQIWHN